MFHLTLVLSVCCTRIFMIMSIEQRASKILKNCFNTNIYSYLETSGGQSLNQYLNVVYFFNTNVDYTSVAAQDSSFLHRCLCTVLCKTCYDEDFCWGALSLKCLVSLKFTLGILGTLTLILKSGHDFF